jgi:hypothetical protein
MASIEVNMDAAGWNVANTASFSEEGPHTVDFRFTDVAGNNVVTNHAFSIDKTPPTITMNTPNEGKVVSRNVIVSGTAEDTLSWSIWEPARALVFSNIIPVGSISLTVDCNQQPDRVIDYNANTGAFDFKWDRPSASSGTVLIGRQPGPQRFLHRGAGSLRYL